LFFFARVGTRFPETDNTCDRFRRVAPHTDNGGEFLNWALHRHLTGRTVKLPWTRSRAYRKNDNAHCEQKNWTHGRQLFGHDGFGHPELVALMNDL